MVKDTLLRLLFIPALGFVISYVSEIVTYSRYTIAEVAGSFLYFVFVSFCIWRGCQWIHLNLRRFYAVTHNPFVKISTVCFISGLYGTSVSGMLCLLWMRISREDFNWLPVYKFIFFDLLAVILFTLVYEILYLSKERERDSNIVDQLDHELTRVEMSALRNELDPHFIFNSLNSLSHLITSDSEKAHLYNNKLAQVYKYFLINKDKELISIQDEIDFIENYFFLLKIRYDDNVKLEIKLNEERITRIMIVPCALQILIENAIKHNGFSDEQPLQIGISMNYDHLTIKNNIDLKLNLVNSTKIGLKNLIKQYQLCCRKQVVIENDKENFIVRLPLIKTE